jgi:dihydrofolate reductase
MRIVRYNVAASLDGYIAGAGGEYDWIPDDPTVDFAGLFANIDTVLLGRRSYEAALSHPTVPWPPGSRVFVFSRTLDPGDHPDVTVVAKDPAAVVAALRAEEGSGEIWLFGGGVLFASLLEAGQVDSVEVTVVPMLLGTGVPLLSGGVGRTPLRLERSHVYPSGMVALHYRVEAAPVPAEVS